MLPLVAFAGEGSELYRGLGSVVLGGLLFSTMFTLFLVPAVFSLTMDMKNAINNFLKGKPKVEEAQPLPEPEPPQVEPEAEPEPLEPSPAVS